MLEPLGNTVCVSGEIVAAPPESHQRSPRNSGVRAAQELVGAAERVQRFELVARPGEPALLELAGHREEPLRGRREIFARDRPPPRVRASAPVREDAAREHHPRLSCWTNLLDRRQIVFPEQRLRDVELGLDVRLLACRPDGSRIATRPEQQPDRLREDRLARTCLPGEDVQPRRKLQLRFADQDEVLDAQPTKQSSACSGARTSPPATSRAASAHRRAGW